jgi:RHS repeat-associated protein
MNSMTRVLLSFSNIKAFALMQMVLAAVSFTSKAQEPVELKRYVCPEEATSIFINDAIRARKSDGICNKGTRLIIKNISDPSAIAAAVNVTRLDNSGDHTAQVSVVWNAGKTGTVRFDVWYKAKVHAGWGDCDFRERYMYTYIIHRGQDISPGGTLFGKTTATVPTSESESTFTFRYQPSTSNFVAYQGCNVSNGPIPSGACGLQATKIRYWNGRYADLDNDGEQDEEEKEITVTNLVRTGPFYGPTLVTYYTKGQGAFILQAEVSVKINGGCEKWYPLQPKRVNVYSSCYLDDVSQVTITPSGMSPGDAHDDGSFSVNMNQSYTLNVGGITDFPSHYTWDFSDLGAAGTHDENSFSILKIGSYRITAIARDEGCPSPKALEIVAGGENMELSQQCTITLPDQISQFYPDIDPTDVILQHFAANVETERSIILKPGITLELGAELVLNEIEPDTEDENMNFVEQTSYDEYGRVTGKSRNYFDARGVALQSQYTNLSANVVLANATLYDAYGRGAVSTLSAPVRAGEATPCSEETQAEDTQVGSELAFVYKPDFVKAAGGQNYTYSHFDLANETTPVSLDATTEGTLGWYYGASNGTSTDPRMNESFVARTQYPYRRTLFHHDGSGDVRGVTKPGDVFKAGSAYLATTGREPVTEDDSYLNEYLIIRSREFEFPVPASVEGQFFKSVSTDESGKRAVTYTDKSEKTIISLYFGEPDLNNNYGAPITKSYQFYDHAGRLLVSLSPNGVNQYQVDANNESNFSTIDKTRNFYNSKGLLMATEEKVAGQNANGISRTEYVYRKDGKIRFSENEAQRNATQKRYSYTNYDKAGRPFESGEYVVTATGIAFNSVAMKDILENTDTDGGLSEDADEGEKRERVRTYYDEPDPAIPGSRSQRFVHGGVSYTKKDNTITTWYSYDELGRVEWMVQDIKDLGVKTIDCRYGPTGQVQDVIYQKGVPAEQFVHFYEYDADGRLFKAYTSQKALVYNKLGALVNPEVLTLQATYYYYLHGPLKRVELANKLQGIDYVYTIDGALKGINHADPSMDPQNDGPDNNGFRKDVFGMTLDYYTGDYEGDYEASTLTGLSGYEEQHTGLIKAMRWHSPIEADKQIGYAYQYDQRNQFTQADWGIVSGSLFTAALLNPYREEIGGYDANGNIATLKRNASTNLLASDNASIGIADFLYHYKANSNTLDHITQGNETFRSYVYNDLGQMTQETEGDRSKYIAYDVTGKVTGVYADSQHDIPVSLFVYDDRGFRLSKTTHDEDGEPMSRTWYVRDASGNVVSTYDENVLLAQPAEPIEMPVYGSGKLGLYKPDYGITFYELTDHLGNVRAVIGETLDAEFMATMESELEGLEEEQGFKNLEPSGAGSYANHTPAQVEIDNETYTIGNPDEVNRLNNRPGGVATPDPIGTGIMLWVHPGDVINAEVFAKYTNFDAENTNLLAGLAGFLTETFGKGPIVDGSIFNVVNNPEFAALPAWADLDDTQPRAFLNYLLFDNNSKLVDFDFAQVTDAAEVPETIIDHQHERLALENITIEKEGFIYIYVSNESDQNMEVYFDDLRITQKYSDIVAGGDFYPFGLEINDRQITRDNYRHGYQGRSSEKDGETGWNHFELREYDPVIGRWTSKDPAGQYYSPYVGMGNNPVSRTDLDGGVDGEDGGSDDWGPSPESLQLQLVFAFSKASITPIPRNYGGDGSGSFMDYTMYGVDMVNQINPIANAWNAISGYLTGHDMLGNRMSNVDATYAAVSVIPIGKLGKVFQLTESVLISTSSASFKLARTYTIYDGKGKLFKFGVTDPFFIRYNISKALAGPHAKGRYSSVMYKYEAHIMEKYLRSLHYTSTGITTLRGMKVPYPIDLITGQIIKP